MPSLVVHGHFYQPPRENPWTGEIDREVSAAPFPNWNARILDECYAANRAVDNYRSLSFDFGPTLLDWLDEADPVTVKALVDADRASQAALGHGNALAHGYNHAILPLLAPRNRLTQVRWGLAHFRHLYGRDAEGFWLPETAADDDSLDLLAREGVAFTVLSPGQLAAVRPTSDASWRFKIQGGDLGRAYRYRTRAGSEITLFFYDGTASGEMAFGSLLEDGKRLADRLRGGLAERSEDAPLFSVALDGESFGHHHRQGAKALATALEILKGHRIPITNFAAFLAAHPPQAEALLREPGSWSCPHGVERWRDHCGCTTGGEPSWVQTWRRPLFEAIRGLEEDLAAVFERDGVDAFHDPWVARDRFIDVLLPGGRARRDAFLAEHAKPPVNFIPTWSLLEMERYALLMFTSCGWFFDDPARLETRQVLRYAARALEYCPQADARVLEARFLERLRPLRSNKDPRLDGERLFRDVVATSRSGAPGSVQYEDPPSLPGDAQPVGERDMRPGGSQEGDGR